MRTAAKVGASPFYGQPTFAGVFNGVTYTGQPFTPTPGDGVPRGRPRRGLWQLLTRAGMSYDLLGDGRNVVKFNYARYVGGGGGRRRAEHGRNRLRPLFPWVDLNADRFIQANEIVLTAVPLSWASGLRLQEPGQGHDLLPASTLT